MYARTNYLVMVCNEPCARRPSKALWPVAVESGRTPVIDTISVVEPREIDRRFANGDLCFLVHDGGQCLGFIWGHVGDCYIRGAAERLTLDPHSVYLYGVYTVEEMRRRGVYDALQEKFIQYYRERQVTRIYTMIEKENRVMKKIFLQGGFRIKSNIHYVRYRNVGVRYVYDYETRKMAVKFINREPRDCAVI